MTQQPERPTCATCPYFAVFFDKDRPACRAVDGLCKRLPPVGRSRIFDGQEKSLLYGVSTRNGRRRESPTRMATDAFFPAVTKGDWCGEHPDFPAWIKATRAS